MPGRRHHTVSFFLLNHFARQTDRGPRICQLDVDSGQPRQISPRDATVSKHFYSVLDDNQERTEFVEVGP